MSPKSPPNQCRQVHPHVPCPQIKSENVEWLIQWWGKWPTNVPKSPTNQRPQVPSQTLKGRMTYSMVRQAT